MGRDEMVIASWEDKWLDPDYDMATGRYRDYEDDGEEEDEVDVRNMTEEEFIEYDNRVCAECAEALRRIRERFEWKKGKKSC